MRFRLLQERDPRTFLVVFDRGDEVLDSLTGFARDHRIRAASFQAIGALERVTFAYWNRRTKQYEDIEVDEQVEVVALTGNIAVGEQGEPKIHAHIAVGYRDGQMRGGHLMRGTVFPTLELVLNDFETNLARKRDPETELFLLELK